MRNAPAESVTDWKTLPVASCNATTLTPGRMPPVESVTTPLTVASCAWLAAGHAASAHIRMRPRTTVLVGVIALLRGKEIRAPANDDLGNLGAWDRLRRRTGGR